MSRAPAQRTLAEDEKDAAARRQMRDTPAAARRAPIRVTRLSVPGREKNERAIQPEGAEDTHPALVWAETVKEGAKEWSAQQGATCRAAAPENRAKADNHDSAPISLLPLLERRALGGGCEGKIVPAFLAHAAARARRQGSSWNREEKTPSRLRPGPAPLACVI